MAPVVECVVKNATRGGEAPHWDAKSGCILYIDMIKGDFHSYNCETGVDTVTSLGLKDPDLLLTFVIPATHGGYVSGYNKSVIHWTMGDPTSHSIITQVEPDVDTYFNDGKCDSSGRLWAGTMVTLSENNIKEKNFSSKDESGSLYRIDGKNDCSKMAGNITLSNGITWSPDDSVMYFADSAKGRIYKFDFDKETGIIENQQVFIQFPPDDSSEIGNLPDGMCTDSKGNLWVACYGAGKIANFDGITGKILQVVTVPAIQSTSCCFGGENLDELYVTSASFGYAEEDFKEDPLAGSLFRITGLGVTGLVSREFEGSLK